MTAVNGFVEHVSIVAIETTDLLLEPLFGSSEQVVVTAIP
jgi:hypothetical protein